jgi:hypothetical protein
VKVRAMIACKQMFGRLTDVLREGAIRRHKGTNRISYCRSRVRAMCKCLLIIALAAVQIGCEQRTGNRISLPKNPTPLPGPNDLIEIRADAPAAVTGQSHE